MKERIVIEKEVLCKLLDWVSMQTVVYKEEDLKKERKIVLFGKEYKTEKEPESWTELVELYKELEKKNSLIRVNILKDEMDVLIFNTDKEHLVGVIEFYYDGKRLYFSFGTGYAIPIEIPMGWQIIKGLIGE